jgi:predicted Zn-dependent protease
LSFGLFIAIYQWGIPLMSRGVARWVSPEWEKKLGSFMVDAMTEQEVVCDDEVLAASVNNILQRLLVAAPKNVYQFQIKIIQKKQANAFAAPGGFIVVYNELIENTSSPEELAGVLAHEIEHVLQRHGTQAVLSHLAFSVLIRSVMGDVEHLVGAVQTLGTLAYNRKSEDEADKLAFDLLMRAKISPEGFIHFFESLQKLEGVGAEWAYFSSHPASQDRMRQLREKLQSVSQDFMPIATEVPWVEIQHRCQKH